MKKIIFLMLLFVMSIVVMPNVYAADNEAKVEEKLYSLEQAIEQVKTTGGTIELQDNVKLSNILEISVEKPITIQLNEHNIESEQDITIVVRKGEVTFSGTGEIKNTKSRSKYGTLYVKGSLNEEDKNYTHLIIEQGVSITGPNPLVIDSFDDNSHHCYGAVVDIYGKIENNLLGVKSPAAISIDARLKDINNAPVVNIHDDAVIGNKHDGGVGIYLFGFANINAEKATIEAHTGIFAATGSINLEGTTITGNGKEDYKEKYGRGTGTTGAAIQIESNSNYTGNVKVNIDGGRYTSEHNAAVVEYTNGATETSVKEIKISGGEFKSAEEYNAIDTSESFKENNKGFITGGTFVGNEDIDSSYLASGYELGADGSVEVIPSSSSSSSKPETSEPTKEETMITEGVTFEDTNDGLVIEGNIIENKTDTYEKMIEYAGEKGYGNLFKMYEFHVKGNGSLNRNITITFDLGEENNGKKAYILHQKHDNSYEEWERKVEDGKVSITVSELSPFTVMLESTVDNEITNNPQTGDNLYKYLVLLCVGSLGMIIGLKPLTRKFAK